MSMTALQNNTYHLFKWRTELTLTKKILLAIGMACLTGLVAQIRIPLPFTPIPITGQTFAVLLAGILLGKNWGGISQIIYASLGIAGIPWFSGATGGTAILLGPTGGYIIGFILAAFFLGYVSDKYVSARKFTPMLALMIVANFVFIFIPGLIQLGLWMHIIKGQTPTLLEVLSLGMFPFILGGLIKSFLAATIATSIMPKKNLPIKLTVDN